MKLSVYLILSLFAFSTMAQIKLKPIEDVQMQLDAYVGGNYNFSFIDLTSALDCNQSFSIKTKIKNNSILTDNNKDDTDDYSSAQSTTFNATLRPMYKITNKEGDLLGFFASVGYSKTNYSVQNGKTQHSNDDIDTEGLLLGGGVVFAKPKIDGQFDVSYVSKNQIRELSLQTAYRPFKNQLLSLNLEANKFMAKNFDQNKISLSALFDTIDDDYRDDTNQLLYFQLGPSIQFHSFDSGDQKGMKNNWIIGGTIKARYKPRKNNAAYLRCKV